MTRSSKQIVEDVSEDEFKNYVGITSFKLGSTRRALLDGKYKPQFMWATIIFGPAWCGYYKFWPGVAYYIGGVIGIIGLLGCMSFTAFSLAYGVCFWTLWIAYGLYTPNKYVTWVCSRISNIKETESDPERLKVILEKIGGTSKFSCILSIATYLGLFVAIGSLYPKFFNPTLALNADNLKNKQIVFKLGGTTERVPLDIILACINETETASAIVERNGFNENKIVIKSDAGQKVVIDISETFKDVFEMLHIVSPKGETNDPMAISYSLLTIAPMKCIEDKMSLEAHDSNRERHSSSSEIVKETVRRNVQELQFQANGSNETQDLRSGEEKALALEQCQKVMAAGSEEELFQYFKKHARVEGFVDPMAIDSYCKSKGFLTYSCELNPKECETGKAVPIPERYR